VLVASLGFFFGSSAAWAQDKPTIVVPGLPEPAPGATRTYPTDISGGFRVVDQKGDTTLHFWTFQPVPGQEPPYRLVTEGERDAASGMVVSQVRYNYDPAPPPDPKTGVKPDTSDLGVPYAEKGIPGRLETHYRYDSVGKMDSLTAEKSRGGQMISGGTVKFDDAGHSEIVAAWNPATGRFEPTTTAPPAPAHQGSLDDLFKPATPTAPATAPGDEVLQQMLDEQLREVTRAHAQIGPKADDKAPAPTQPGLPAPPPAAPPAPNLNPTGAGTTGDGLNWSDLAPASTGPASTLQEDPEVDEFYARLREHLAQVVADLVARRERMVAGLGGKTWRPDTSSPAATASAADVFKQASGPIKIVREFIGTLDTHHENWRRGDMSSKEFYQLGYRLVTDALYDPTGDQGGLWGALQTEINARFFGICEFYAMVEENHQYLAEERVKKYVAPDVTYNWWAKDQQKDAETVSDDVQHIASLVPRIRASRERLRLARAKWIGALSAWEQYASARVQEEGDVHDRARQVIADTLGKFTDTDFVILHAANSSHGGVPLRSEWADLQLAPGAHEQFYLTGCAADPVASLQATPGTVAGVPPKPPVPDTDDSEFSRLSRLATLDHARAKLAEDRAAAYLELATADALRITALQEKVRSAERRQLDPRQRELYNQIDQENIAQCQQDARDELAARQRAIQDGYDYTDKANATAALLDKEYRRISSGGG
jgi:hypothetical protein